MKKTNYLIITVPLMLILVALVVYKYGYLKIKSDMTFVKDAQDIKTKTLEKYLSLIAEKPQLEKKLALLKEERKADNSKLFEGQTPSLSAALLQETIKGIVTEKGGIISSERVGKPEDFDKFKLINVSIDAVLPDARALSDILYSIETRTPFLVVKELDLRIKDFKDPRELIIKLDISALTSAK